MTVLEPDDVDSALAERHLRWQQSEGELVKVRKGRDFADALSFVNAVGELAEAMNHHPDIDIRWNTVTLRLSTHSAGGITLSDLELAGRIDSLEQPSAG
ncbi:MAG TPA: 4a-hydroxytetrahydrobiopterin dehydratase [Acidimicrobiales bacterium]|nr:4a-hydroxytetrahydrobiopterin dehydratase [Acidimicrobiales bacterium]